MTGTRAFGWADPHLYSYWLRGDFWDSEATEYTAPYEMDDDKLTRALRSPS